MRRARVPYFVTSLYAAIMASSCSQESVFSQSGEKTKIVRIAADSQTSTSADASRSVSQENKGTPQTQPTTASDDPLKDLPPAPASGPTLEDLLKMPGVEDLFKKNPGTVADQEMPSGEPPASTRSSSFEVWCKGSGEVRIMSRSGLKAIRDELCNGDQPTELFTKTLIRTAYSGSGTIQFTPLRDLASDSQNRTTGMRFAFAIKIPIDVKTYFDKVSPRGLEPAALKAVVEGPGGTGTVTVLENYSADGIHHLRGVLANQVLVKQVRGRTVNVESDTRTDHFSFVDGEAYMYTTTVMRAISSMVSTDTISALIKVENDSYFINVVDTVVPNRGYPQIAEPELARSTQAGAMALYNRIVQGSMP